MNSGLTLRDLSAVYALSSAANAIQLVSSLVFTRLAATHPIGFTSVVFAIGRGSASRLERTFALNAWSCAEFAASKRVASKGSTMGATADLAAAL